MSDRTHFEELDRLHPLKRTIHDKIHWCVDGEWRDLAWFCNNRKKFSGKHGEHYQVQQRPRVTD